MPGGYKDFAVGEVLASSDVDEYLMRQTIMRVTSGTRPSSPAEGWWIYETDTDRVYNYSGSAWRLKMATDLYFVGSRAAVQSIANNSATALAFTTEVYDPKALFVTDTFTVPVAGVYAITFSCGFAANATGQRVLRITVNGNMVADHQDPNPIAGATTELNIAAIERLASGDTVQWVVVQTSGGSLNTGTTCQRGSIAFIGND